MVGRYKTHMLRMTAHKYISTSVAVFWRRIIGGLMRACCGLSMISVWRMLLTRSGSGMHERFEGVSAWTNVDL